MLTAKRVGQRSGCGDVLLVCRTEDTAVGVSEPMWVPKSMGIVSILGALGYEPNTLTTAPLRSCRLQHSTIGRVVSQIKPKSPRDTRQSAHRLNVAENTVNVLPGELELPTFRLTASRSSRLR